MGGIKQKMKKNFDDFGSRKAPPFFQKKIKTANFNMLPLSDRLMIVMARWVEGTCRFNVKRQLHTHGAYNKNIVKENKNEYNSILQVPTTPACANMSVDPEKFVELTADVLEKQIIKYVPPDM